MDTTDASKSSTTTRTKNVIAYNSNVDVHGSNSTSTNRNTIVTKNGTAKITTTLFPKKKEKNKVKLSKEKEMKSTTDRKGDTSKTATNGIARRKSTSKSAHKALHRLTPSGKLLSCYVVQGELRRKICLLAMHLIVPFRQCVAAVLETETETETEAYVASQVDTLLTSLDGLQAALQEMIHENISHNKDVEMLRIIIRGCLCDCIMLVMEMKEKEEEEDENNQQDIRKEGSGNSTDRNMLRTRTMSIIFDRCAHVMKAASVLSPDSIHTMISTVLNNCCISKIKNRWKIEAFGIWLNAIEKKKCWNKKEIAVCIEHVKENWMDDAISADVVRLMERDQRK